MKRDAERDCVDRYGMYVDYSERPGGGDDELITLTHAVAGGDADSYDA